MEKWISDNLKTKFIGRKIFYFKEIDSTNTFAKTLAEKDKEEGTVVIAEKQNAGRGRFDRVWFSPAGGIYLSIILKPEISLIRSFKITLLAGVSTSSAIEKLVGLKTFLKWPNDVLFNSRKISGILTEVYNKIFIIVGIGINTNISLNKFPEDLRGSITTVKKELGREISNYKLIRILLEEFEKNYLILKEGKDEEILKEWKEKSQTLGMRVKVISNRGEIKGRAVDLDENGFLLVELQNGRIEKIMEGDVFHLPTFVKDENY